MSRGTVPSHYSSRKLEACTLQMSRWSPFVSPPVYANGEDERENKFVVREDTEISRESPCKSPPVLIPFKEILSKSVGNEGFRWPSSSSPSSTKELFSRKMRMLPPSLSGGWNKRQKQLSQALSRGLWRWREGVPASKRRRKSGSSRSCGGGSGRSSDSRRGKIYVSDHPTISASGPYATCSDIPIPGTDSSGELFFYGDGWDSEFPLSGEHVMQKRDGLDVPHAWIVSETQSTESGYGSEPGYRGDEELGYEDDCNLDEQDEEERQQLRLSPWREGGLKPALSGGNIFTKITEEGKTVGVAK